MRAPFDHFTRWGENSLCEHISPLHYACDCLDDEISINLKKYIYIINIDNSFDFLNETRIFVGGDDLTVWDAPAASFPPALTEPLKEAEPSGKFSEPFSFRPQERWRLPCWRNCRSLWVLRSQRFDSFYPFWSVSFASWLGGLCQREEPPPSSRVACFERLLLTVCTS